MKIALELGISYMDGQLVCRFVCNEPQNFTHPCDCAEYVSEQAGAYCKFFIAYRTHPGCRCPAARAALARVVSESDVAGLIGKFVELNSGTGLLKENAP